MDTIVHRVTMYSRSRLPRYLSAVGSLYRVGHKPSRRDWAAAYHSYPSVPRKAGSCELSPLTFCRWRLWKQSVSEVSMLQRLVAEFATDAAQSSVSQSASLDDVFERYNRVLESGGFEPEMFESFAKDLCCALHSMLSVHPWLYYNNVHMCHMQIAMNDRKEEMLCQPLYSHPLFPTFHRFFHTHYTDIPEADVPSVLMHLLYSGLRPEDLLTHALLERCSDAVPVLDLKQLKNCMSIVISTGRRHLTLQGQLAQRLDEIVGTDGRRGEEGLDVECMCQLQPMLGSYMSDDLMWRCTQAIVDSLKHSPSTLDINNIGNLCRYMRKLINYKGVMLYQYEEHLGELLALVRAHLDRVPEEEFSRLQSSHMASLCHNAKLLRIYQDRGRVAQRCQARSLELLKENNLPLRELTSLLFPFTSSCSEQFKQEVGERLTAQLKDADVLTLSNLADSIISINITDCDVILAYQAQVKQHLHNLSNYITRLPRVLRFLQHPDRLRVDPHFNQYLCSYLCRLLKGRQGLEDSLVMAAARFILPNVQTAVPAVLMEALRLSVPRFALKHVLVLLNDLSTLKGPMSRTFRNQILDLRLLVQENVLQLLENTSKANQLADLILGLHVRARSRDITLLHQMMQHLPRLTVTMDHRDFHQSVLVLKLCRYYLPQAFENLIAYAQNNYASIGLQGFSDLVSLLALTAYHPRNFSEFAQFSAEALMQAQSEKSPAELVFLAQNLSLMQIYNDDVLAHIFSFDFLQLLDEFMEAHPSDQGWLSLAVMELNRSVILECPQLDVPWFHQDYCTKAASSILEAESTPQWKTTAFRQEVGQALEEVTGGPAFLRHNARSPYFHHIDFEVVLDPSGEPIPSAEVDQLNPQESGYQRVAVMTVSYRQTCTDSQQLTGQYLNTKRHLQMLGYRLEQIERQHWNSMAMSGWKDRLAYLRHKIFLDAKHPTQAVSDV